MEFELLNTDGKYVTNVVIETLEQLVHLSIIYNKRPIVVDIKEKTLLLKEREGK